MSKRDKVKTGIQQRVGNADDVMYGDATLFDEDFFANIDDSSSTLQAENEALKTRLAELQSQSMQLVKGTQLQVGDFVFTPTHLVIPPDATEEALKYVGDVLLRLEGSVQWLLGDWLVSIDGYTWGRTEEIAAECGREVQTLYNYKSIAAKVNFYLRRENLSFNHHALIAHKTPEEQTYYLDLTEWGEPNPENPEERVPWTVAQLRDRLRQDRLGLATSTPHGAIDLKAAKHSMNHVFNLFKKPVTKLTENKKNQHLWEIETLRRLLDEAERKVREASK